MSKLFQFLIMSLLFCTACGVQGPSQADSVLPNEVTRDGDGMSDSFKTAIKRRKAIWEAMGENQYPETRPLLTLEQFFLHSNNKADLWYNIVPHPKKIDQYEFHRTIRERADVWDVLISITQLDSIPALEIEDYDESKWFEWPNSDHTLIITSADEKTIRSWFPPNVQPDEISIGNWNEAVWASPKFIPNGFHQAWLWYD